MNEKINTGEIAIIKELQAIVKNYENPQIIYPITSSKAVGISKDLGESLGTLDNFIKNFTANIVNVETLPAGENASANVTMGEEDGTYKNRIYFKFGIPQGMKGAKGDKGEQGPKGDPGEGGTTGNDGITPHIGENDNWFIGEEDTKKPSRGERGERGDKGQIIYKNGLYDLKTTYETTKAIAACVQDPTNNKYYVLNSIMKWNGSSKDPDQKGKYPSQSNEWIELVGYKEFYNQINYKYIDAPKKGVEVNITDPTILNQVIYTRNEEMGTICFSSDVKNEGMVYDIKVISEDDSKIHPLIFKGKLAKEQNDNRIYFKTPEKGSSYSSSVEVKGTCLVKFYAFKSKRGNWVDWYAEIC